MAINTWCWRADCEIFIQDGEATVIYHWLMHGVVWQMRILIHDGEAGEKSRQRKIVLILTWYRKEMRHCCNIFQRTILQRMSTKVNVYMQRHQTPTLVTWFITNFHMVMFAIGSVGKCHGDSFESCFPVNTSLSMALYTEIWKGCKRHAVIIISVFISAGCPCTSRTRHSSRGRPHVGCSDVLLIPRRH